jgi:hypothetical protein
MGLIVIAALSGFFIGGCVCGAVCFAIGYQAAVIALAKLSISLNSAAASQKPAVAVSSSSSTRFNN